MVIAIVISHICKFCYACSSSSSWSRSHIPGQNSWLHHLNMHPDFKVETTVTKGSVNKLELRQELYLEIRSSESTVVRSGPRYVYKATTKAVDPTLQHRMLTVRLFTNLRLIMLFSLITKLSNSHAAFFLLRG